MDVMNGAWILYCPGEFELYSLDNGEPADLGSSRGGTPSYFLLSDIGPLYLHFIISPPSVEVKELGARPLFCSGL